MRKKCLISDLSKREIKFMSMGRILFGEINGFTYLFRLIGKFVELQESGNSPEILDFRPEESNIFKYENIGISTISERLNRNTSNPKVARRMFVYLSRKWMGYPVVVSYNVSCIIQSMLEFINCNNDLRSACIHLLARHTNEISHMMPIQSEFLEVRMNNDETKRSKEIAREIVLSLNQLQYNVLAGLAEGAGG